MPALLHGEAGADINANKPMGYEIIMLVGKSCLHNDELERDTSKPFEDASGFDYKRDENGQPIKTGRKEHWFMVMATIDLCKLGYQDDALNKLISRSFETAKEVAKSEFWYFYPPCGYGNARVTEDGYGALISPVPIAEALAAMKTTHDGYRRTGWAIALLESMAADPEELEVMFWGH